MRTGSGGGQRAGERGPGGGEDAFHFYVCSIILAVFLFHGVLTVRSHVEGGGGEGERKKKKEEEEDNDDEDEQEEEEEKEEASWFISRPAVVVGLNVTG